MVRGGQREGADAVRVQLRVRRARASRLQYYCRADHYSYARYGIPSVSLSRGAHMDYHQVTDEPQYIDYPDYARLTQMVFDGALFVANADHAPRLERAEADGSSRPCRQ